MNPNSDPIMERLEDQISWYAQSSSRNKLWYRWTKITEIIAAACIPFMSTFPWGHVAWITGGLGVLITILEGLQHLNQSQQNWINYRSTSEALKHEKYLYLAHAGPYAAAAEPHSLLAERIESLISQESAKWNSIQQEERAVKSVAAGGDSAAAAKAGRN
jgi:Protein of unknown function (DUF4231)